MTEPIVNPSAGRLDEGRAVGPPVPLTDHARLDLSEPGPLWFVESGRIEVYYADRSSDLPAAGRRFLFELESGNVLPDLSDVGAQLGIALFAIGFGAQLRPIDHARFAAWLRNPSQPAQREGMFTRWIRRVTSRLTADHHPPRHFTLPVGETVSLPTAEAAQPADGVCWVERAAGTCLMNGRPELQLRDGEILPVSRDLWLESVGAEARVRTMTTGQLLQSRNAMDTLATFNRRLLGVIVADDRRMASGESERLRQRAAWEARIMGRSYDRLGDVMNGDRRRRSRGDLAPTTPLVEACRLVARELGLDVEAPPERGDGRGVGVKDPVAAVARASRLRSRKVMLRADWWTRDNGPLLAFREADNHPVALLQRKANRYEIHDPAAGTVVRVSAEVAATLAPVAYMFFPSFGVATLAPKDLWRMGLRGVGGDLRFVLGLSAATGLLAMVTPIVSKILFDDIVPQANRSQLPVIAVVLVVFAVVSALLGLVRQFVLLRMEAKMELNMEAALMDRLLRLPAAFFQKYLAGDLADRVLGIAAIRSALTGTVLGAILSGVFSIVSLALLLYYDATLAVLGFVLALVAVGVILASSLIALRYNRRIVEISGSISGLVLQLMAGIPKLRTAAAEPRAFGVWAGKFAEQERQAYRAGAVENNFEIFEAAYPIITSMLFFGTIYLMTERAGAQTAITTGTFIAVISAFGQFLAAMLALGGALISVLDVVPFYERMKPILETPAEVSAARADPGYLSGDIEVTHLTFRYSHDGPVILNDVSLRARPGEMIALVGPSGSGKSTLIRLLLGFDHPESGSVYFDGKDLAGLDLEAVRQQFGVVLQQGQLTQGDILGNIIGPWNLSQEDAWAAAAMVGLDEDIAAMPMGMHTLVNEDGGTFSGGQKQRLMIARAIVHRPSVLLLDEATSALDNRTQRIVSESLKRLRVTRIVIAHRLSTIREADRIYVLDAGRIVESGTYATLLEQKGHFAQLAERQML